MGAHCSFNSMSCTTACTSAFTRVGVNMSQADVCYTECVHVCRVLHLVLKCCRTEHVSSDDVVRALTFRCSFIPATTGTLQTVESLTSGQEEPDGVMQADKGRRGEVRRKGSCMRTQPGQCTDMNEECKAASFVLFLLQGDFAFRTLSHVSRGFISSRLCHKYRLYLLPHTCTVRRLTALMGSQTGNYNQRQLIHI